MIRDKKFYDLVMEMVQEHEEKSQKYSGGNAGPMENWKEVLFLMRPWKGCMARMTEKWSRMKQIFGAPTLNLDAAREILKELAVYAVMTRELLDEDAEASS
jgi:hypothetical protein